MGINLSLPVDDAVAHYRGVVRVFTSDQRLASGSLQVNYAAASRDYIVVAGITRAEQNRIQINLNCDAGS